MHISPFSFTKPASQFDVSQSKKLVALGNMAERVQKFKKNEPFIVKVQIPLDSRCPLDHPEYAQMLYDESRKLAIQISLADGWFKKNGGGRCASINELSLVAQSVVDHGSGAGEFNPRFGRRIERNIRGYMQACVLNGDCIRVFVDRVYPRQPW